MIRLQQQREAALIWSLQFTGNQGSWCSGFNVFQHNIVKPGSFLISFSRIKQTRSTLKKGTSNSSRNGCLFPNTTKFDQQPQSATQLPIMRFNSLLNRKYSITNFPRPNENENSNNKKHGGFENASSDSKLLVNTLERSEALKTSSYAKRSFGAPEVSMSQNKTYKNNTLIKDSNNFKDFDNYTSPKDSLLAAPHKISLESLPQLTPEEKEIIDKFNSSSSVPTKLRLQVMAILSTHNDRLDLILPNYEGIADQMFDLLDRYEISKLLRYRLSHLGDIESDSMSFLVNNFIPTIAKASYADKEDVKKFVNQLLVLLCFVPWNGNHGHFSLQLWSYFCLAKYGTLELCQYAKYPELAHLSGLLTRMRKLAPEEKVIIFENLKSEFHATIPQTKTRLDQKGKDGMFIKLLPDLQLYNSLITTLMYLSKRKHDYDTVELLWGLKDSAYRTNTDLGFMIESYIKQNRFSHAAQAYGDNPTLRDLDHFTMLLRAYGALRKWKELRNLFDNFYSFSQLPNMSQYGIMMDCLADIHQYDKVILLYKQIIERNMIPSRFIFLTMMKACLNVRRYVEAIKWFLRYKHSEQNLASTNVLDKKALKDMKKSKRIAYQYYLQALSGLRNTKLLVETLQTLKNAEEGSLETAGVRPTLKMYTVAMNGCAYTGDVDTAIHLFKIAKKDFGTSKFDEFFIASYLSVFAGALEFQELYRQYDYAVKVLKISAGPLMYAQYLRAAVSTNDHDKIDAILAQLTQRSIELNGHMYRLLIEYYCKVRDLETAQLVLKQMYKARIRPSASHFTPLMKAFTKVGDFEAVKLVFNKMVRERVPLDGQTDLLLVNAVTQQEFEEKNFSYDRTFDLLNRYFDLSEQAVKNGKKPPLKISLAYKFIDFFSVRVGTDQAKNILREFRKYINKDKVDFSTRIGIARSLIKIKASERDFASVGQLFDGLIRLLVKERSVGWLYAATQRPSKDPLKQSSRLLPQRYSAQIVQPMFKFYVSNLVKYKFQQLLHDKQLGKIPVVLFDLLNKKFEFSNTTVNHAVTMVASYVASSGDREAFYVLMLLVDRFLINNFAYLRRLRQLKKRGIRQLTQVNDFKPRLYLSAKSFSHIKVAFKRAIMAEVEHEGLNPRTNKKAVKNVIARYKKKYPKTIKTLMRNRPIYRIGQTAKDYEDYKPNRRF